MGAKVFLSYARLNLTDEAEAWLDDIARELAQICGRQSEFWWDRKLDEDERFDDQLADRIAQSDLMLVLYSQSWLESDPCWDEYLEGLEALGVDRICFLVYRPFEGLPPDVPAGRRAEARTLIERVAHEHQTCFNRDFQAELLSASPPQRQLLARDVVGRMAKMIDRAPGRTPNDHRAQLGQEREAQISAARRLFKCDDVQRPVTLPGGVRTMVAIPADAEAGVERPFLISQQSLRASDLFGDGTASDMTVADLLGATLPPGCALASLAEWGLAMRRVGQPLTGGGLRTASGRLDERETWAYGAWGVHPPPAGQRDLVTDPYAPKDHRPEAARQSVILEAGEVRRRRLDLRAWAEDYGLRLVYK